MRTRRGPPRRVSRVRWLTGGCALPTLAANSFAPEKPVLDESTSNPNDLQSYWLPFTPNRAFKTRPRLLVRGECMHYWDKSGRKILDAISGLWCVNAGPAQK